MRVFVTGASGWIGSAVVRELIGAGHQVVGLARSDASSAALTAAGAAVHRGTLDDLDSLRRAAAASDGVIHLAFKLDIAFSGGFQDAADADRRAVETIGATLKDSGKPLVVTSGTVALAPGRLGTEADAPDPNSVAALRNPTEVVVIAMAERGVRASVVRLPPVVHGEGDLHGFVPSLIGFARAKGVSAFVGDGLNRWPAVHRLDAARLFWQAMEAAPAGSRLHGVGEEGVLFREIAEAIGRKMKLPVVSIAAEDAGAYFGFLSAYVPADIPASSALTQERLGWRPEGPTLIADIVQGHYIND